MLNSGKRGAASISSLLRLATSTSSAARIASTRPSILSLPVRKSSPFAAYRSLHATSQLRNYAATSQVESSDAGDKKVTHFHELATHDMVHPNVIEAITKGMKITTMTEVQTETINQALQGIDM